jgi:hypothetical protein
MKPTIPYLIALLLVSLVSPPVADASAPASKPNVLIILVDDMGYGDPRLLQSRIEDRHTAPRPARGGRNAVHRCPCGSVHLCAEPV